MPSSPSRYLEVVSSDVLMQIFAGDLVLEAVAEEQIQPDERLVRPTGGRVVLPVKKDLLQEASAVDQARVLTLSVWEERARNARLLREVLAILMQGGSMPAESILAQLGFKAPRPVTSEDLGEAVKPGDVFIDPPMPLMVGRRRGGILDLLVLRTGPVAISTTPLSHLVPGHEFLVSQRQVPLARAA